MNSTATRTAPHKRFDVTIRGGGVVGRTLALLLARDRLRVALVVAPPPAGPDVRAYALNAASRALLQSVRAWPEDDANHPASGLPPAVTPVTDMQVFGDADGAVNFSSKTQGGEALSWIVDVPALEARLAEAVRYQAGIEVCTEAPPARLTVICEGKRSATRAELGLEFDVQPYPHSAVAGRLRCAVPHGGVARQWFAHGEIMALLPLDGPQGNSVALVWSVDRQKAQELLQADAQELNHAIEDRCGHALGAMQLLSPAQAWPLELSKARRWVASLPTGGVALAGDAAHAMHPLAGQGLNVGLGDVAELARVLHAREYWRELGDLKLLRRYERARQADVNAMGWVTDGLFGLFSHADNRVRALRNWGMKGFERSGALKHWIARRASGLGG